MRVHAPAKINLHLRVGKARSDGFHPLISWMCTVGFFDTLDIERAGDATCVHLAVDRQPMHSRQWATDGGVDNDATTTSRPTRGDASHGGSAPSEGGAAADVPHDRPVDVAVNVPADANNLVARAAVLWSAQAPVARARAGEGPTGLGKPRHADHNAAADRERLGLTVRLTKRVPVGAGLGGGSSDAARTLLALNDIDHAAWSRARLAELGARLGSDVPFFFFGPSSVCTGRGEVVRPIAMPRAKWVALYMPGLHVSTPAVYRQFDAMRLGRDEDVSVEPDWTAWSQLPADELMPRLVNDLEAPAFVVCKELSELRSRLERVTGRVVRMSGSGSTLFTLFDEEAEALGAVARSGWPGHSGRVEVVPVCPAEV